MSIIQIHGSIEAMSSISHIGDEKSGSTPTLRSMIVWDASEQEHVRIPFISGNAIRGMLRRLLMKDFLDQLGYENKSQKLHHVLFTGGVLEATDDAAGSIDLRFRNEVRESIPPLALLGTSIGNQMIQGCLLCDHAIPLCRETASVLRLTEDPRAQRNVMEFTQVMFQTRRDDIRAERSDDDQAMQMKIEFEAFVIGTLFEHGFVLKHASDVEASCLGRAIELWREFPYIGGKAGSGHGKALLQYSPVPTPDLYLSYLRENGPRIVEVIDSIARRFEGPPRAEKAATARKSKKSSDAVEEVEVPKLTPPPQQKFEKPESGSLFSDFNAFDAVDLLNS